MDVPLFGHYKVKQQHQQQYNNKKQTIKNEQLKALCDLSKANNGWLFGHV